MTEGRSRGKQPSAGRQNKDNWEEEKLRAEKNRVEEKNKAGRQGQKTVAYVCPNDMKCLFLSHRLSLLQRRAG